MEYIFKEIEKKWRVEWENHKFIKLKLMKINKNIMY